MAVAAFDFRQRAQAWLSSRQTRPATELPRYHDVVAAGIEYNAQGELDHFWYRLRLDLPGSCVTTERCKVVRLALLTYIPREAREQVTVLEKMRKLLKGTYNASVDFICVTAGIWTTPPMGVIQCYGVQCLAETLEEALRRSAEGMVALTAGMSNFEQSRLQPLSTETARWIYDSFKMPFALTVIGHPDPRENARGMGAKDDMVSQAPVSSAMSLQQNEMVFRGMARAREEFMNVVIATAVPFQAVCALQERIASEASKWASQERFTRSIGAGIGIPMSLTGNLSEGASQSWASSDGYGITDTVGDSHAVGHSHTEGTNESWGESHSEGKNWSTSEGRTQSWAHTEGTGYTESYGVSAGRSTGEDWGTNQSRSEGGSEAWGTSHGTSHATGHAETNGVTDTTSWSHTDGSFRSSGGSESHSSGVSGGQTDSTSSSSSDSLGANIGGSIGLAGTGISGGVSGSHTEGSGEGHSDSSGWSSSDTSTSTWSSGSSSSDTHGGSHAVSHSSTDSESWGESWGTSHATGTNWADTAGSSHGVSVGSNIGWNQGWSASHMSSDTYGESRSMTQTEGSSVEDGTSHSRGVSASDGRSVEDSSSRGHGTSETLGYSRGRGLSLANGLGVGAGLVPSISFGKTFSGEDHVATLVATALRQQEALLATMAQEGAFLVDNYYLVRTPGGRHALEVLVPQAYHGVQEVVTPVRTRRLTPEQEHYIKEHAQSFTPAARPERNPWALEGWKDTTLLTMLQTAAYTSPGMFEEGAAVTVQERIPSFLFMPNMPGEVVLGNQISFETGLLTDMQVHMDRNRMSNWAFCADTRFGKSVAAQRLVLETALQWHYRNIVLDFGAGWRALLNAMLPDRVTLWGLNPDSPHPIRWNPLQVHRIDPEIQLAATCEIFANAGRMGERQLGFMRKALTQLYKEQGVLVNDRAVWEHPRLGYVQNAEEWMAINAARAERGLGQHPRTGQRRAAIRELTRQERQAVAAVRSTAVDMTQWYNYLERIYAAQMRERRGGESASMNSIDGVLIRFEPFTQGEMNRMYGRGSGTVSLEDLAKPWGVAILEGGRMDEYAKATILGLMAWHLYEDAVVRREWNIGTAIDDAPMNIVFEEANKVLGAVGSEKGDAVRASSTDIFTSMFRDAGKYNIFLAVIAQSPSVLPPGILSSCNNLCVGQLKNVDDVKTILPALARTTQGFHDQDYMRYIGRIPQGTMILKLGLSQSQPEIEPMLFRPLRVDVPEPSNAMIEMLYAQPTGLPRTSRAEQGSSDTQGEPFYGDSPVSAGEPAASTGA